VYAQRNLPLIIALNAARAVCPVASDADELKPETDLLRLLGPSKLPAVGTTIFTVMSQLAQEHRAVNLGQGFPDFDCEPQLKALVSEAMQQGHNQYAPMAGLPLLRQAIAEKVLRLYGRRYDTETEITVTAVRRRRS